jgi:hypothetical protein
MFFIFVDMLAFGALDICLLRLHIVVETIVSASRQEFQRGLFEGTYRRVAEM